MSYPVGRDFIPSMAHNELVRSKVETAVGTIINPLDKSEVSISTTQHTSSILLETRSYSSLDLAKSMTLLDP